MELGERLGVSPSMASRLRNGRRRCSVSVLRRLSDEFDIPLEQLVEAHGRGEAELGALVASSLRDSNGAGT